MQFVRVSHLEVVLSGTVSVRQSCTSGVVQGPAAARSITGGFARNADSQAPPRPMESQSSAWSNFSFQVNIRL